MDLRGPLWDIKPAFGFRPPECPGAGTPASFEEKRCVKMVGYDMTRIAARKV